MKKNKLLLKPLVYVISFLIILASIPFLTFNVTSFSHENDSNVFERDLSREFCNNVANFIGDDDIAKTYVIPEGSIVAPKPDQNLFGTTENADEVDGIITIAKSDGLANDADYVWSKSKVPNVSYYCDETICSLAWKESIDNHTYNFAEVVVAHPSQFRRMFADNSYGSNNLKTTSSMCREVNAVIGMSGDFYGYRPTGVVVYRRNLYFNNGKGYEVCYVDSNGDFIFDYSPETKKDTELREYIKANDILFNLCFGPVLVDNGEIHDRASHEYIMGQVLDNYSRAAIGQIGERHYLLCTVDGGVGGERGTNSMAVGAVMHDKGCVKAYSLDGGQTATIYHNGKIFNRVGYGNERPISDIIYFATGKTFGKETADDVQ